MFKLSALFLSAICFISVVSLPVSTMEEEIPKCGTYEVKTEGDVYMHSVLVMQGVETETPVTFQQIIYTMQGDSYIDIAVMFFTVDSYNNTNLEATLDKVEITLSPYYIDELKCEAKEGVAINVNDLKCEKDHYKPYKDMVGTKQNYKITFEKGSLTFEGQVVNRTSTDGCIPLAAIGATVIIVVVVVFVILLVVIIVVVLLVVKKGKKVPKKTSQPAVTAPVPAKV